MEKLRSLRSVSLGILFQSVLLETPMTIEVLLPFSVLLSTMIALWKLSKTSELIVIRSFGVSVWQFILPLLASAFFIGVVYTTAGSPLVATLQKKNSILSYKYKLSRVNPLLFSREGLWLKESSDLTHSFINAGHVKQKNNILEVKDITILMLDNNNKFLKRIEAAEGIIADSIFKFKTVKMIEPQRPVQLFETYDYPTNLSPKKIRENFAFPESISFWALPSFIKFFTEIGFSAKEYKMQFYRLLFIPVLLCSMVLLASIFSVSYNKRSQKLFLKLMVGIGVGFLTYFLEQVFYAMGMSGKLNIFLSIISVPLICTLISISALLFLEDG